MTSASEEHGSGTGGAISPKTGRDLLSVCIAICLAAVVFFRPWRDGLTFAAFNQYFLFVLIFAMALWGARLMVRGVPLRNPVPIALLFSFLVVAFLTAFGTLQVDHTYRALLYWLMYFFAFVLVTNGVRSERALLFILGVFAFSAMGNSIWAILHYEYSIPYMRRVVNETPEVLKAYGFTYNDEMRFRLQSNRAFGTHLHPNALAAFLIMSIAFALGELKPAFIRVRQALRGPKRPQGAGEGQKRLYVSAVAGLVSWFIVETLAFFLYPFLLFLIGDDLDWSGHTGYVVIFLVLVPVATGALGLIVTRRYGFYAYTGLLYSVFLSVLIVTGSFALWLSKSRGAMLALGVAIVCAGALYLLPSAGGRFAKLRGPRSTAALFVVACVALFEITATLPGWAQNETSNPPVEDFGGDDADVEGRDIELSDLASTESFGLRLSYWRIAWRMGNDHFLSGVGLGNFGVSYTKYLYPGAGITKQAHNVLLKTYAETGIFGVLAFASFWAYFFLWGALRIVKESAKTNRWCLAWLYAACLAFFVHSMVDFGFANPSLAILSYFFAGVFFLRAHFFSTSADDEANRPVALSRIVAVPALLLVALVTGFGMRVFVGDLAMTEGSVYRQLTRVGERIGMNRRAEVARYFLLELPTLEIKPGKTVALSMEEVGLLIPDPELVRTFGVIRVPLGGDGRAFRPLGEGEVPPPNATVYIRDVQRAREAALTMSEVWVEDLAERDTIYPYSPHVAVGLHNWYDMMYSSVSDPGKKLEYLKKSQEWIEEALRRNRSSAEFHRFYGRALLLRGTMATGMDSVSYYRMGVEQFERATELYPISVGGWRQYGLAQRKVGTALRDAGMMEEGEGMISGGKAAMERAMELEEEATK